MTYVSPDQTRPGFLCPTCGERAVKIAARVSRMDRGHLNMYECMNCGRITGDGMPTPSQGSPDARE